MQDQRMFTEGLYRAMQQNCCVQYDVSVRLMNSDVTEKYRVAALSTHVDT